MKRKNRDYVLYSDNDPNGNNNEVSLLLTSLKHSRAVLPIFAKGATCLYCYSSKRNVLFKY